ncbi:MAG TPA: hypothetical protein VGK02_06120 [Candidatus Aquicultor sp.]|jgi:hypothetical protein
MAKFQSYVKLRRGIREHLKIMSATELKVYIDLLTGADFKTGEVRTTIAAICQTCDLSNKVVNSALLRLAAMKYITYKPAKNQWHDSHIKIIKYAPVNNTAPTTEAPTAPSTVVSSEPGTEAQGPKQGKQTAKKSEEDKRNHKNTKEIHITANHLFEHWNSLKIMVHRKADKFLPSLTARLSDYIEQELTEAMDNYHAVLTGEEYFWSYKWGLDDFLKPDNLDKFLTINDPFSNYRKHKVGETHAKAKRCANGPEPDEYTAAGVYE